jgi:hypothetical protein
MVTLPAGAAVALRLVAGEPDRMQSASWIYNSTDGSVLTIMTG